VLIFDADDTLWENNVLYERVVRADRDLNSRDGHYFALCLALEELARVGLSDGGPTRPSILNALNSPVAGHRWAPAGHSVVGRT
jgi:hypothetical protein